MSLRGYAAAGLLALLAGLSVLGGSKLASTAFAGSPVSQTIQVAQTQQATPNATPNSGQQGTPGKGWDGLGGKPGGMPDGMMGGMMGGKHGMRGGPGGFGGFEGGRGFFGGQVTADQANRVISGTVSLLDLVNSDLAYAKGKMDTASVEKWLTSAGGLLKSAQGAVTASKYETAVRYADASRQLAMLAESQMVKALGADTLPSASQRPQGRMGKMPGAMPGANNANITQAQASRMLLQTYNNIVGAKTVLKSSEALSFLTEAQDAYGSAYTAYQAGKYGDAVSSAKVAEQLVGVARGVEAANNATNDPNAPVTVPAPNF